MKFITIAALFGVISAQDFDDDVSELLRVTVEPDGQARIKKQWKDVENVMKTLEHDKLAKEIEQDVKALGHTAEAKALHGHMKKFKHSPKGQALKKEIKEAVQKTVSKIKKEKNGFHIDNKELPGIKKEWNDVEAYYNKNLKGSGWEKGFEAKAKALAHTNAAAELKKDLEAFDKTTKGKQLEHELKQALRTTKRNIKVDDLPKNMMEDDEDTELLRLSFSDNGQRAEKEWKEVEALGKTLEHDALAKKVGKSFEAAIKSKEAQELGKYHESVMKTPEGAAAWKQFGHAAKKTVDSIEESHNPKGLYLDNAKIPGLKAEWEKSKQMDKAAEAKGIGKEYEPKAKALLSNKEAQAAKAAMEEFGRSAKGQALKKELHEFGKAVKETAKWTDVPKGEKLPQNMADEDELRFLF